MHNSRLIARLAGTLFIIGTMAGVLSVVLTRPILDDPNYIAMISANETQIIVGSLLVLIMAFSLAMIPIVLFPIFKRYNEILALGAVVFRGALEAVAYMGIVAGWLLLVVLGRQYTSAEDTSGLQAIGAMLQGAETWGGHLLAIVFCLGALMIYWLFYLSRLVPRWLSVWGLSGAMLYLAAALLAMFGLDQIGLLMAPLTLQEMVLAVWLIAKGFSPTTVASCADG